MNIPSNSAAPSRKRSRGASVTVVLGAAAVITLVWLMGKNPVLDLYVSISVVFVLARILDLPTPSWWSVHHVSTAKTACGNKKLNHEYKKSDRVRSLSEVSGAKTYFMSSIYEENTKKLCTSYQDGLPLRVAGALLAALIFYSKSGAPPAVQGDELTSLLNYFGALAPAALALTWDYSRFERQRTWNREVSTH